MTDKFESNSSKGDLPVYPGLRLCCANDDYLSGDGTYEDQGYIYSSLVGIVKMVEINNEKKIQRVEVSPCGQGSLVARVGDVVTAVVTRVTPMGARCQLRCAGPRVLGRGARAQLRRESVRATEVDRIDMYKCFRPGDIILARILPMTELQCYQLTTAEPELGVVIARAAEAPPGVNMVPLTWKEMQCPVTFAKEPRKVAKVAPENVFELIQAKGTSLEQKG